MRHSHLGGLKFEELIPASVKSPYLSVVFALTRPLSSLGRALYTMVSVEEENCWVRESQAC
jgi:hypothetical protein